MWASVYILSSAIIAGAASGALVAFFSTKKNPDDARISVEELATLKRRISAAALQLNLTALDNRVSEIVVANDSAIKDVKEKLSRASDIAHQAYDITVGMIQDSGVKATKVGNLTVVTGLPEVKV